MLDRTVNGAALPPATYLSVAGVIRGKDHEIDLALAHGGGRSPIEDKPGTGKTTMAKAIACADRRGSVRRVQFTPRPAAVGHHRCHRAQPGHHRVHPSRKARRSRTCSSPTRSTVPRRRRRPHCSR
ncbi:MAG: hypothetical protein R2713_06625 [Ilumatobacteraceae bacterium]